MCYEGRQYYQICHKSVLRLLMFWRRNAPKRQRSLYRSACKTRDFMTPHTPSPCRLIFGEAIRDRSGIQFECASPLAKTIHNRTCTARCILLWSCISHINAHKHMYTNCSTISAIPIPGAIRVCVQGSIGGPSNWGDCCSFKWDGSSLSWAEREEWKECNRRTVWGTNHKKWALHDFANAYV